MGSRAPSAWRRRCSENASKGAIEAGKTALEAQKAYSDAMVKLANSDAGKAAMQLALTAVPGGKAATVLGGLMNAGKSAAGAAGAEAGAAADDGSEAETAESASAPAGIPGTSGKVCGKDGP